ncbi:hypothetical protein AXF42_Ash010729 [Apostasia shenzhenica]|uniref:AB hydrolase-1 domain-containing protein n=1 Tax=Apostasia shenzhenica TaxID=1088818 RepID=A0A2I0A0G6_9ASPA|nr:hypothetical protein AXF42_Ash010729 [Apostasia shenzhenica]
MAVGGKGNIERIWRGLRTVFFMLTMIASLLVLSAPVFVAVGDVASSLALASNFACLRCYSIRAHLENYSFRSSLMDIPLISIMRSLIITCVYSLCDLPELSHGPYLGTVILFSIASIIMLCLKVCLFTAVPEIVPEVVPNLTRLKLLEKRSWGMPVLFLSSLVFALGHVIVAHRTSCRARRKLLFHHVDPESVLYCKNVFSGFPKIPRSPVPCSGKNSRSFSEVKGKAQNDERDLPISLLTDADSLFVSCWGLTIHYKLALPDSHHSHSLTPPFHEPSPSCSPRSISTGRLKHERPLILTSKTQHHFSASFSNSLHSSSLYAPLLINSSLSPLVSDENPVLSLNDEVDRCLFSKLTMDMEECCKVGVVLVHGFGGGVFSWRHIMGALARQIGCMVVAFDRPGWGLTSRLRRKDWEEKQIPNPYKIESQVDLLIYFCLELGFSSIVLVGHDDGGLLVLKAAEKVYAAAGMYHLDIKGVVLLSVSLSREVVPAFARILLHTSLGKKHVVRPLLRTEITQVINRRAWYNPTKLTTEVLKLYKVPLSVEGWDEALHEIGRLSFSTVLSPQNAATLLNNMENLPVLVVTGAEDALVPLKSVQAMASKLINSRLVAISGCGHLPHEECPKALLAALSPFITRLLLPAEICSR